MQDDHSRRLTSLLANMQHNRLECNRGGVLPRQKTTRLKQVGTSVSDSMMAYQTLNPTTSALSSSLTRADNEVAPSAQGVTLISFL